MARSVRSSLKLFLKVVNAVFGILGLVIIAFGFWLWRLWQREIVDGSSSSSSCLVPWFIYATIGVGAGLFLMACLGHFAADTPGGFCLSCYLIIILAIVMFEIAVTAEVYMNSDWEQDLPEDPTGMMDDIAKIVESNSEIFRWLGLSIVFLQVLSILLSVMLRNAETQYESEEEDHVAPQLPLLRPCCQYQGQATCLCFAVDQSFPTTDEAWKIQFHKRPNMTEPDKIGGCEINEVTHV